jgi:NADPH:quinone reductase-like Zn-dependent oxidoreductase
MPGKEPGVRRWNPLEQGGRPVFRWPATFPSGEGSDLAGIVAETGPGVRRFSAGDEVIGWTDNRPSHAEYVVVEEGSLTAKPAGVPWEQAGRCSWPGPPRTPRSGRSA